MRHSFRNFPYLPKHADFDTNSDIKKSSAAHFAIFSHATSHSGMARAVFPFFSINNTSYYIQPGSRATVPTSFLKGFESSSDQFIPATAVDWPKPSFSDHDLESTCQGFSTKDDVWCRSFLSSECGG